MHLRETQIKFPKGMGGNPSMTRAICGSALGRASPATQGWSRIASWSGRAVSDLPVRLEYGFLISVAVTTRILLKMGVSSEK